MHKLSLISYAKVIPILYVTYEHGKPTKEQKLQINGKNVK